MPEDNLAAIFEILGPGDSRHADPRAWERLEAALGFELPGDFKAVVDAYGPAAVGDDLYLRHPATEMSTCGPWT